MNQYGQGKLQCDAVKITQFNSKPDIVWDYDVVVFGFYDCNAGYDLNANSRDVVEKYINSGAGVLFGHDTINVYLGHTYFDSLAKYANLSLVNFDCPYESSVRVIKKGLLTNYPYEIGDVGKTLSTYSSHVSCQIPSGDVWMEFSSSKNFYLTTWNNCAMIQLGHSGSATTDEIKLLMNTINYLAQKTTKTSWVDHMGQDLSAPTTPTVLSWNFTNEMSTLNFELSSQDIGDKYQYYVEATNTKTGEKLQSNTAEVELITGVKGYSIVIDSDPDTIPDNTIDTENNQVEMQVPEECDKSNLYIHVKVIDNAGNVSEVLHHMLESKFEEIFTRQIGNIYEQTVDIDDSTLIPKINSVGVELLNLTANTYKLTIEDYTCDNSGKPFFYWIADEALFTKANEDFTEVECVVDEGIEGRNIPIYVYIGDCLGHAVKYTAWIKAN